MSLLGEAVPRGECAEPMLPKGRAGRRDSAKFTWSREVGILALVMVGSSFAIGLVLWGHGGAEPAIAMPSLFAGPGALQSARVGSLPALHPGLSPPRSGTTARAGFNGGAFFDDAQKLALKEGAESVGRKGRGILAIDEGPATMGNVFAKYGVENSEENRRAYRQVLLLTPGVEQTISGVIMDPETLYQKADDGRLFPERLAEMGINPGVKVHLKQYQLPGTEETVMQGLDSIALRLREYKQAGAVFAKWQSVFVIGNGQPSELAIQSNVNDLARFALICQAEGLVPNIEPDVSIKGDHDLETALVANMRIQAALFQAMREHGVYLEGTILKVNMVNPGLSCPTPYSVDDIAQANMKMLHDCVPVSVPTVNFLSKGQDLRKAAARLSTINQVGQKGKCPWNLSFAWASAFQTPMLEMCRGKPELPISEMGDLYAKNLKIASAAASGTHEPAGGEGSFQPPQPPIQQVTLPDVKNLTFAEPVPAR